mmetsp:Transcript_5734/g.13916  ORF Transcript_5734/g.13916 Transcript_5734/m.13916 type:complete len:463 (-) Transcript_5734:159-1547(-)
MIVGLLRVEEEPVQRLVVPRRLRGHQPLEEEDRRIVPHVGVVVVEEAVEPPLPAEHLERRRLDRATADHEQEKRGAEARGPSAGGGPEGPVDLPVPDIAAGEPSVQKLGQRPRVRAVARQQVVKHPNQHADRHQPDQPLRDVALPGEESVDGAHGACRAAARGAPARVGPERLQRQVRGDAEQREQEAAGVAHRRLPDARRRPDDPLDGGLERGEQRRAATGEREACALPRCLEGFGRASPRLDVVQELLGRGHHKAGRSRPRAAGPEDLAQERPQRGLVGQALALGAAAPRRRRDQRRALLDGIPGAAQALVRGGCEEPEQPLGPGLGRGARGRPQEVAEARPRRPRVQVARDLAAAHRRERRRHKRLERPGEQVRAPLRLSRLYLGQRGLEEAELLWRRLRKPAAALRSVPRARAGPEGLHEPEQPAGHPRLPREREGADELHQAGGVRKSRRTRSVLLP